MTISKTLHCAIGGTESGTLSGFNPGSKYKVRITNNDALSDANYLVVLKMIDVEKRGVFYS